MPRRSLILDHPKRKQADSLILARDRSVASIARDLELPVESLKRYARQLLDDGALPPAAPSSMTAVETFELAFGVESMDYQVAYLAEERPTVVVKGRQTGMTLAAAGLAVFTARSRPGSTTVVVSPSLRQSSEATAYARQGLWELGERLKQDSVSLLRTTTGSRIISLPGSARGIRGYAASLVVLDEAAFIDDAVWTAARPLVAASKGRLVVQSTAGLPVGWFHTLVTETPEGWARLKIRSDQARTIDADFLARELAQMGEELYRQEYGAEFGQAGAGFRLFDMSRFESLLED